jgi:predicted nucleic acid-binding protein
MNLVDSSGWMEYLSGGKQAAIFEPIIENTDELIVSVINKYEVYRKFLLDTDEKTAIKAIAAMYHGRLVDITDSIAMTGVELSIEFHLPLADSLLLATARSEKAILWTLDSHFKDIPDVRYFNKE